VRATPDFAAVRATPDFAVQQVLAGSLVVLERYLPDRPVEALVIGSALEGRGEGVLVALVERVVSSGSVLLHLALSRLAAIFVSFVVRGSSEGRSLVLPSLGGG
jgi:hypothetical protein